MNGIKEYPLKIRFHRDIDNLLEELHSAYQELQAEKETYKNKLSDWNKERELQSMQNELENCRESALHLFVGKEKESEQRFREQHYQKCKNGNQFGYLLTGTGIGTSVEIQCPVCGETKDITDYSFW